MSDAEAKEFRYQCYLCELMLLNKVIILIGIAVAVIVVDVESLVLSVSNVVDGHLIGECKSSVTIVDTECCYPPTIPGRFCRIGERIPRKLVTRRSNFMATNRHLNRISDISWIFEETFSME